jgi:hypothetical protein
VVLSVVGKGKLKLYYVENMIYTIFIFTHEEPHNNTVVTYLRIICNNLFRVSVSVARYPLCEFASKQ